MERNHAGRAAPASRVGAAGLAGSHARPIGRVAQARSPDVPQARCSERACGSVTDPFNSRPPRRPRPRLRASKPGRRLRPSPQPVPNPLYETGSELVGLPPPPPPLALRGLPLGLRGRHTLRRCLRGLRLPQLVHVQVPVCAPPGARHVPQPRGHQHQGALPVGEGVDHAGSSPYLAVEPLQRPPELLVLMQRRCSREKAMELTYLGGGTRWGGLR